MSQILSILQSHFVAVLNSTALLYLVASAVINTMPAALPNWRDLAQWCWGWMHDAAKLFLNLRNPPPPGNTTSLTEIQTHSVSVERPLPASQKDDPPLPGN
jgi:hypothetical protein